MRNPTLRLDSVLCIPFYTFIALHCNMYFMAKRLKVIFIIVMHFLYHSLISLLTSTCCEVKLTQQHQELDLVG